MGGAQMLIRNKMLDLESRGWNVIIFYYFQGQIMIPEFKRFSGKYRIPELQNVIFSYSKSKVKEVVNRMASFVEGKTDIIIESDLFHLCFWGELLAREVKGIHLLYFVTEDYKKINNAEWQYLLFKQKRGEWVNHISIKKKIALNLDMIKEPDSYLKMPSYNNVLSSEKISLNYDSSLPVITSIGRLEKNYILPMVEEIIRFVEVNNIRVNLFFVGGAEYDIFLVRIKDLLSKTDKVIPHFFGYLYPIPENIIEVTDVAIATSGSVKVPILLDVPTISICVEDCMPLGVFGHTTNGCLFRNDEPIVSLSSILTDIIINGKFKESIHYVEEDSIKMFEDNSILIKSLLVADRCYYDCFIVASFLYRVKFYFLRIIFSFVRKVLNDKYRFYLKKIIGKA